MHLLKPLALFLATLIVTDASSSSNLPEPLSRFLAVGNSAFESNIGEGRRLVATYVPSALGKMEEATHSVRSDAAAYAPLVWEKLEGATHSVRNSAAIHGPRVLEKAEKAAQWSAANPVPASCALVGVGGVVAVVAPGIVSAPILSSAGFGATGVQSGSAAAAIHSAIGNVGANSFFGLLQSAGASASGLAVVNGVVQVGGAVAVGASSGVAWVKSVL